MKRGRNQRRRPGGGSNPNRALDSNGPEVRIRGTATQIYDKYTALARDASSSGDRIKAESYLQHAEHYYRVIRASQPAQPPQSQQSSGEGEGDQPAIEGNEDAPNGRRNNHRERRPQDAQPNAQAAPESETPPKAEADANSDTGNKEPASEVEAEKKPKRRRAPRRPKAAAESDAAETGDKTPATAAE